MKYRPLIALSLVQIGPQTAMISRMFSSRQIHLAWNLQSTPMVSAHSTTSRTSFAQARHFYSMVSSHVRNRMQSEPCRSLREALRAVNPNPISSVWITCWHRPPVTSHVHATAWHRINGTLRSGVRPTRAGCTSTLTATPTTTTKKTLKTEQIKMVKTKNPFSFHSADVFP